MVLEHLEHLEHLARPVSLVDLGLLQHRKDLVCLASLEDLELPEDLVTPEPLQHLKVLVCPEHPEYPVYLEIGRAHV
jgi:hypothetical protein